jgi:hypothetical protein
MVVCGRMSRPRALARILRGGLALAAVALATTTGSPARGQGPEDAGTDLATARQLFTDAMADESAKRFDTALDKYRRVGAVKDTANVRYRMATCLEALGRRAEALSSYQAAARLSDGDRTQAEVFRAASEHAGQLDRVVPRLTIVLPAGAPVETQVRVDDSPVDAAALHDAMPLEPGTHTISATAPGDAPFRTAVTLGEGGRVSITVDLSPIAPRPAASASAAVPGTPPAGSDVPRPSHGAPAGAWVALGLGGALAAGSVVSFVLRSMDLNTLDKDCPPSTTTPNQVLCTQAHLDDAKTVQSRARIEGPLGIGLGAGAVVSLGVGVWLLASSHSGGVQVAPVVSERGAMLVVGGPLDR